MSSFQDTFTKNETMDDLEYDDAASFTFFGSILFVVLIAIAWNVIAKYLEKPKFSRKKQRCKTKKNKIMLDQAEREFNSRKSTGFFKCKVIILIILLYLFIVCVGKASVMKNLKTFDPYEILEVEPESDEKIVKRAYRKLVMKYHPDRNSDDPDAQKKFILLNKAMKCLTDPKVKEICKKTGNPDGAGSFQVGIAIPNNLLEKKNRTLVLSLFFIIILVVIPVTVWLWYTENEKYGEGGISNASIGNCFRYMRNESVTIKNLLEMCASSYEMLPLFTPKFGQGEPLSKIVKELKEEIKPSVNIEKAMFIKPFYLMYAYMKRVPIHQNLMDDLRYIHRKIPILLNGFESVVLQIFLGNFRDVKVSLQSVLNFTHFAQAFYQGMWVHDSPFFQIPGVNDAAMVKIERKLKKSADLKTLVQSGTEEEISKFLSIFNTEEERVEAEVVLRSLPNIKLEIDHFIEGEEEKTVHQHDITTIKITLTDLSIPESETEGRYMHSNEFLYPKYPTWIFYIMREIKGKEHMINFKVAKADKRVIDIDFQFPDDMRGEAKYRVLIKPDCYIGFDEEITYSYTVGFRRKFDAEFIHEDDKEAMKQETIYSQLMANFKEEDSDEELEDEPGNEGEEEEEEDEEGNQGDEQIITVKEE